MDRGSGTAAPGSLPGGGRRCGRRAAGHGVAGAMAPDEPAMLLGGLLTRLQANSRGSRLPSLPSIGSAPQQLLQSVGEFQQHDLLGLGPAGDFSVMPVAESVSALRQELISKSTRTVDKLTIELVGMLFDHVMQDKQVPAEIKARLSRLQFPVLKAALMDAAFFASSAHPARKLIDRIAGTSAGWEPYGDDNQRYLKEVDRVVTDILKNFETDITVFERLYGEFDKFVSDVRPEDSDPVSRAKKALEAAEKHEILTINTTIQVRRAFERVDLEPYIKEFLLGAWVKVLVAATVRNETQPGFAKAFREVIHELVWSVQPKASNEDRSKLVKLIPNMVRVLRDGLGLINVPGARSRRVLQASDGIARDGGEAGGPGDLHQVEPARVGTAGEDRRHAAVRHLPGHDRAGWNPRVDRPDQAPGAGAQGGHRHAGRNSPTWPSSTRWRTRACRRRSAAGSAAPGSSSRADWTSRGSGCAG